MPKREDLKSILIIGAGPIVIGQACEFDYSGTQAVKALREEGYRVILVNSNPATIMTDPEIADASYIEPIEWNCVQKVIAKERPDALLPTMGGQTALNCALDLARHGVLEKYNVELIGASQDAIDKAENRTRFRNAMDSIGLESPRSHAVNSYSEALAVLQSFDFPIIIRPSFTLGGTGGGIAYDQQDFERIVNHGLDASPTTEVLLEESVLGWKEYEMEVVRDKKDNCIIICSIENIDAMGVHTGDSITVAPAQTLTDKEYQIMRNASIAVLREIGVETGGSNVQFALNPQNGRMVIIEMNPRVSRSSALASKATGFPIARVAAKLAIGYTLDELANEITGGATPASFEPTIDYVVTKIPRFDFEKFPQAAGRLSTQMQSVGEVMAMGSTFCESLQKALRGLEIGLDGLNEIIRAGELMSDEIDILSKLENELNFPGPQRLRYIADAMRLNWSLQRIHEISGVDPWFLNHIQTLIDLENEVKQIGLGQLTKDQLFMLKQYGFSDSRLGTLSESSEQQVRALRYQYEIHPVYKRVDSCAAEFACTTAYMYSTYQQECEAQVSERKKIIVLGGGPNRIGQGIEFDYCCVHAAAAASEAGYESIMINCNPETVSTDFDSSDRLYFEPLTLEDVLEICRIEDPTGVIVHYGGQTPLKLAQDLAAAGVNIVGTSPDAIDSAEDREQFQAVINALKLQQPPNGTARSVEKALAIADEIGFPLVVRPSYVLGGRAMEIVYNHEDLASYMTMAIAAYQKAPVLLDRFLDDAVEVDVDAVSDGEQTIVCGIMEHIEQAGVHSGDSACSLPPISLSEDIQQTLIIQTKALAEALKVCGLMNVQYAIKDEDIYVLEVNPRASRTVPFVAKATSKPWARIAAHCMLGRTLQAQGIVKSPRLNHFAVKEAVFPFVKFAGVDLLLGPEMKSTGEVMGLAKEFDEAFYKAVRAAGEKLPLDGKVFLSVKDRDKSAICQIARRLAALGFELIATKGTAKAINNDNITCVSVNKVQEGSPNIVDIIKQDDINLIVNTTEGKQAIADSFEIRRTALQRKVPYATTIAWAMAMVRSMERKHEMDVIKLQSLSA